MRVQGAGPLAAPDVVARPAGASSRARSTGTVMLSFDCEGKWGLADCLSAEHRELYTNERLEATYRGIASLLSDFGIPATFAFTAAFTLAPERFARLRPEVEQLARHPDSWFAQALAEIDHDRGEGWFAPACFDVVRESPAHEIASHGFSHIPWRSPSATREVLDDELRLLRSVPEFDAGNVSTFVYPRNQVAHTDLLAAHGFQGFRDARPSRSRAANLANEFNLLSPSESYTPRNRGDALVALPPGYFLNWRHGLRRCVPVAVTVARWEHILLDAIRRGGIVHVWTHPENFVDGHAMFPMFSRILQRIAEERDAGHVQVLTSAQFIARERALVDASPAAMIASSPMLQP